MKKIIKGEYGYINYQKKITIIRTAVFFALCAAVFTLGYVLTGNRKNLLTVVAILGCLPACKSLVNTVMFFRARGCSGKVYKIVSEKMKTLYAPDKNPIELYELYLTSYKVNYPISHITLWGNILTGIAEDSSVDIRAAETHIKTHLAQEGVNNITVKLYGDIDKYTLRLGQLAELKPETVKEQETIINMLLAISL